MRVPTVVPVAALLVIVPPESVSEVGAWFTFVIVIATVPEEVPPSPSDDNDAVVQDRVVPHLDQAGVTHLDDIVYDLEPPVGADKAIRIRQGVSELETHELAVRIHSRQKADRRAVRSPFRKSFRRRGLVRPERG